MVALPKLISAQIKTIVLFILIISTVQCVERFEPSIDKYDDLLVVEAYLTNEKGSGRVILSRSYAYNEDSQNPYINATVSLIDESGEIKEFEYYKNSTYVIGDPDFQAQIDRAYMLRIELNDGTVCESSYSELPPPIKLDSLYYNYTETQANPEGGLQFYIDASNEGLKSLYYYWDYTETWEFKVPIESDVHPSVCYRYNTSKDFNIKSTEEFTDKNLNSFPLYFIPNPTLKFDVKYSILVNQHNISQDDYLFYKKVKEVHENNGSLFDKTPNAISGNITNITNPEIPVLGNFRVSSVSSKRLFIHDFEKPSKIISSDEFSDCASAILIDPRDRMLIAELINKQGWVVMKTEPGEEVEDTIYYMASKASCFNCSITGTKIKPDFWDND